MRTVLLTGIAVLALLSNACSDAPKTTQAAEVPDGATYVLAVEGMSCAVNCAPSVKASLESIEGVKRVEVSFEDKRAVVVMAAGHSLTKETAERSFGNDGYFISEITESASAPKGPDSQGSAVSPQN